MSTAFRLRHRFLQAVQAHQPHQVSGLLEADETCFRESKKGCRKMPRPSRARGGKATPKGSARDMVPVLVGRVRGTHQVSDSVLTAMTVAHPEEALRPVVGAWVNRQLRGVSTRHLPNYLAWMRLWEWFKEGVKPEHFVVSGLGRQLVKLPTS